MPSDLTALLGWADDALPPLRSAHIGAGRDRTNPARSILGLFALGGLGRSLLGGLRRALLGSSQLGGLLGLDHLDRAAGLLHRLARALRHARDLEAELGPELALAE